jgi:chemotaxis protein CheD
MTNFIGNEITYLLPGQLIVSKKPLKISTILGSCISVCLFDPILKHSGMNHYLMPLRNHMTDNPFRYGDTSLSNMLFEIIKMGSKKEDLHSYVYGGSSMFTSFPYNFNIGKKNIEIAFDFLEAHKIRVIQSNIGGEKGRKIIFDTSAGTVSCSYLHRLNK